MSHPPSSHDSGRRDTLDGARLKAKRQASDPSLLIKKALHATKRAAQTATTIIGLVGTEMTGERVLQPNSPASMVTNALGSTNKTKQLARRIYFSFVPSYRTALLLEDISRCFQNREQAERVRFLFCFWGAAERGELELTWGGLQAFAVFDKDGNGDISLDELEMACLEIHRERLALSNSMRDIDSAVGRCALPTRPFVAVLIVRDYLRLAGSIASSCPFGGSRPRSSWRVFWILPSRP